MRSPSLSLVYTRDSGGTWRFKDGVSRGDGVEGEDVGLQARIISGVDKVVEGGEGDEEEVEVR